MAEAAETPQLCVLCSEESSEPITLGCDHCFCSSCLKKHWAPSLTGDCPACRRRWSKILPPDFALEEELGQEQSLGEAEKELHPASASKDPEAPRGEQSDARQVYVTELKGKKERTEEVIKQYKSMLELTDRQTQQCETRIKDQFRRFREFLDEEEEMQLKKLKEESLIKTQIIEEDLKKLDVKRGSLLDRISSAEQQGQSSSLSEHMETLNLTDEPKLRPGLLLDQAEVLGNLGYRVWEKMGSTLTYSPVILDPNTAYGDLSVSEDLTSVKHEVSQQQLPLNPERITNHSSVLGSKVLSSGSHQWVVEVGDHPDWVIGVATESAEKRSKCDMLPENGFLCLKYKNHKYKNVYDQVIRLRGRPEKILVRWQCYESMGKGRISFYDTKYMSRICSYCGVVTVKMFPYLSVGKAGSAKVKDLKICPNEPTLMTSQAALTFPDFTTSERKAETWAPDPYEMMQRSELMKPEATPTFIYTQSSFGKTYHASLESCEMIHPAKLMKPEATPTSTHSPGSFGMTQYVSPAPSEMMQPSFKPGTSQISQRKPMSFDQSHQQLPQTEAESGTTEEKLQAKK